MSTIPANKIVSVVPGVLGAGGSSLVMNGVILTDSGRVPIGTVASFSSPEAVSSYFGSSSIEAALAAIYFAGFDNASVRPGSVLFANYPLDDVFAYLRGGDISALTLSQLQAISGTLTVVIDGDTHTGSVNLSSATSFSRAAVIIANTLLIEGAAAAAVTAAISGTVMTVTDVASGVLAVGQFVHGTGVTAGTYISSLGTGTGGTGTYNVSSSQTVSSSSLTTKDPGVSYDSVSGAMVVRSSTDGDDSTIAFALGTASTSLKLTSATGAVLSQGASATTPTAFMTVLKSLTQNWASFMTTFNPDVSGNANKLLFSQWTALQSSRYVYVCWDTDVTPTNTVPATSSLGYLLSQGDYGGTVLLWDADESNGTEIAAFVCGCFASIDFSQNNGRTNIAFRQQSGLVPGVTDETTSSNLISNGYNYYGVYATGNDQFTLLYPGSISGDFQWADSYINQIWLNNQIQLAGMTLLTTVKSIPYNLAGRSIIEAAFADPINAALRFGAIRAGVTLSSTQATDVNTEAGINIANTLSTRGWYLQVLDATPQVRASRGTPPCKLWYMDGQSVQSLNISSINVQ